MVRPLEGVKVLDLSRQMAGPYATLFLSDYGAEVIKVESIPHGDGSRGTGTHFQDGEGALFLMWNRGKRSIALDLRSPEGLATLRRMADTCDVIISNYRPGVIENMGLTYDELSKSNPGIISVSISAFGRGVLDPFPGTDPIVQAMSGVMSVTGEEGGAPVLTGVPIADFTGAMLGAQAVMLGLLARQRTGKGQHIDVSMLYGLLSMLTTRLASFWATGENPTAHGSAHSVVAPYQAFRASDGWVVAGVWGEGDGWEKFCRAVDMPHLLGDKRFATNVDRVGHRAELTAILDERFSQRSSADWEAAFRREQALFGPVYRFSDILSHPQVVDAGLVQSVKHPKLGDIPQLGPVIDLHSTPGAMQGPPPMLGEHTREVLRDFAFSDKEIDALLASGAASQLDV